MPILSIRRKFIISAASVLLFSFPLLSQKSGQVFRREFETDEGGTGRVDVIGSAGVMMHGQSTEKDNTYIVTHLNNQAEELYSSVVEMPKNTISTFTYTSDDFKHFFVAFTSKKGEFKMYHLHVGQEEWENYTCKLPKKFVPTGMFAIGNTAFLIGNIKRKTELLMVDLTRGTSKFILFHGGAKDYKFSDYQLLTEEDKLVLTHREGKGDESVMKVNIYNLDGTLYEGPYTVGTAKQKFCISGMVTWMGQGHFLLTGTYSSDKDLKPNGMYVAEFKNKQQTFNTYESFTELSNFSDLLLGGNRDRKVKKVEKKKEKGKTDFLEAYLHPHRMFEHRGYYVMVGEVYYPTYRLETYTSYVNGRPNTSTRQVFDGYQYTHAIVMALSKEGEKLWDMSFPMWPIDKPFSLINMLQLTHNETEIKMICIDGPNIQSCVLKGQKMDTETLGTLALNSEYDRLRTTSLIRTQYWYDNYFITYGTQRIKNKEEERSKRKRTVFFISKIAF